MKLEPISWRLVEHPNIEILQRDSKFLIIKWTSDEQRYYTLKNRLQYSVPEAIKYQWRPVEWDFNFQQLEFESLEQASQVLELVLKSHDC